MDGTEWRQAIQLGMLPELCVSYQFYEAHLAGRADVEVLQYDPQHEVKWVRSRPREEETKGAGYQAQANQTQAGSERQTA